MRERRPKGFGSVTVRTTKGGATTFMLKVTREGRDHYRTVDVGSKSEALARLPSFVAEIQSGAFAAKKVETKKLSEQPTLSEYCPSFLSGHVTLDPDRLATRAAYGNMLRLYILPTLGRHKLSGISGAMVRECLQDMHGRGRAISTIQLAHAALRRLFDAAIDDGLLKENPTPRFSKLRLGDIQSAADSAKRHALSASEVTALRNACGSDVRLRLFVSIMASCGLRPGEANGLYWRNIDLRQNILHVRGSAKKVYGAPGEPAIIWIGKTKTPSSVRSVTMGPILAGELAIERERQEALQRELLGRDPNVRDMKSLLPEDACIFPADPTTAEGLRLPHNPKTFIAQFKRAAKRAGLPHVSPHWLRHTAISHALAAGATLADASKRAGHSNPAITAAIYLHTVSDGEKKAAQIGDSLLAPAKSADVEQIQNGNAADKGQE